MKIVVLKNTIDNIKAIENTSFSHLYIIVSLCFISANVLLRHSKMSIFFN